MEENRGKRMRSEPLLEHRLNLAGWPTRALELEGEGPPYLLFHGFSDSADTWRLLLDRLAREGRPALALDLPGFGTAGPLRRDDAVLAQLDRFADAALEHAGDGAIAIGNSLGGCMAMRLAERTDGRLGGVVALAPAGLDMSFWIDLLEASPLLAPLLAVPSPVSRAIVRATVGLTYQQLALAKPGSVDGKIIAQFTSHFRGRQTVAEYLAIARRLRGELQDPYRLDRVSCPVLLVFGDRDRLVPPTGADRVLAEIPGTRFELFEGCGHCPQIEEVERLVELLLEFSSELETEAA
jgi:pimeloyl-ACP methyl ester carboxylesterase